MASLAFPEWKRIVVGKDGTLHGALAAMVFMSLTALASGCADEQGQSSAVCTAFDTQECVGPAACRGGQMCKPDGSGWTPCDCGIPPTGVPNTCSPDLKASTNTCVDSAAIRSGTGLYWINNNVWGRPMSDTTDQQCSWLDCLSGENLAWGSSWNWKVGTSSVKAYPSVILGWQWGLKITNTGLPMQLAANRAILSGWDFSVTQSDPGLFTLDVAYDLWIHTIPNPDSSAMGVNQPSDEVMIWLYRTGSASPAGSPVTGAIPLAGTTWELWEGPVQSWSIHTFLRTANTNSSVLDINDFLQYLVANRGLDSSKYLTSIQSGTEVWFGSGELDTSSYYCTVQ